MNRRKPTTEERKALARIEALRTRTPWLGLLAIVPTAASPLLPERRAANG